MTNLSTKIKLYANREVNFRNEAILQDDGKCRLTCTEDYPSFKEWLEEGNTPLPADNPPQENN